MTARRIDLNADVGESFGAYVIGNDRALMRSITSASIAAGFHGGDPSVLRDTIRLAKECGVAVGAHPGFPDLGGFGRRDMRVGAREAEDLVLYQIAAVAGVASTEGVALQHVKPHGALYNMAARDEALAGAIARAIAVFDRRLILFGPPGSALLAAARTAGLRVAREAFADRAYDRNGDLVSRTQPGSVLADPDEVAARAVSIAITGTVTTVDGAPLTLEAETICLHGDTPGADRLAAHIRTALDAAGVSVRAVAQP